MEDPTANPTSSSSPDRTTTTADEPTGSNSTSSNNNSNNNKTAQCSVVSIYRMKIAGAPRHVTVAWTKSLINHSFAISVERPEGGLSTCKVELKPWPFWSKKGYKSLDVADDGGAKVDVFWDLRSAKFSGSGSPEPAAGYYVALVFNEEVILLVGDGKKDAYKRTKSRPCLEDAVLVSKRENVFGRKSFAARARFDGRKEHDIVVESAISGPKEPEMWISVDGVVLVRVSNLQWKFRGNETVIVDESPVQVLWDVHDWLFAGGPGSSGGLFVFKPGAPEPQQQPQPQPPCKQEHCSENDHASTVGMNTDEDCASSSSSSAQLVGGNSEFCFYLFQSLFPCEIDSFQPNLN